MSARAGAWAALIVILLIVAVGYWLTTLDPAGPQPLFA